MVSSIAIAALVLLVPGVNLRPREGLQGLEGVYVVRGSTSEKMRNLGLTHGLIDTATELRLRAVHIRVLTHEEMIEEMIETPGQPMLCVTTTFTTIQDGYCCSVEISVIAGATMIHNRDCDIYVKIWSEGRLVTGPTEGAKNAVKDAVLEIVDEFANDYLAVNPKDGEPAKKPEGTKRDGAE